MLKRTIFAAAFAAMCLSGAGSAAGGIEAEIEAKVMQPCARDFIYGRLATVDPDLRERALRHGGGFEGLVAWFRLNRMSDAILRKLVVEAGRLPREDRAGFYADAAGWCLQPSPTRRKSCPTLRRSSG